MKKGTLYIVATPIGNLEDITFRAVRILSEVDLVAAEDTRHSRKLLAHLGISKPLTSYYDHNKELKGSYILDKLKSGLSVALVSDAGTPCISDPGYQLVRAASQAQITVVPIPGPSAFLAALSASGLQTDSFAFEGFLPNRREKRRSKLSALKEEKRVLIFYESPRRLLTSLTDALEVFGDRNVVVAREITKVYEELMRGLLSEAISHFSESGIRGEVVILVAPDNSSGKTDDIPLGELLRHYLFAEKLSLKDAVKKVSMETGLKRGAVYEEALIIAGK